MNRLSRTLKVLMLMSLGLTIASTGVQGQEDQAFLTYRQKLMASIGANMGAIGVILKTGLPFTDKIQMHAYQMQLSSTLIEAAFEKEITAGRTDAKPEIWQEWDKFVAAAQKLGEESGKLGVVAKAGDQEALAAQIKATGKSCGGCHKPYRKPKGERFER